MAADGVQKRGRGQELAVAQGAVQEKHLETARLFRQPDSRSETEASGGRGGEQGQGGEEEERPEVALGDRFRLFIQTLNNAKKPFNSIFNSKTRSNYSFKEFIHSKTKLNY